MNKNSNNNRDAIDCIEFNRDATKFDSERQYLVTLNTRNNRTQRSTDIPNGGIKLFLVNTISKMLPKTTKQSKRLNNDTKYPWKPKLYIFSNISIVNRATKNIFV